MKQLLIIFIWLTLMISCKKESITEPSSTGTINLSIGYEADGNSIQLDSIMYPLDSGCRISIETLHYYLSEIKLIRSDGLEVLIKNFQYVSIRKPETNVFSSGLILQGEYKGVKFNFGLDSLHNIPDGLPNSTESNNMIWPVPMGGGYHFMKFEGHFTDSSGTFGYAMHLGKNENLFTIQLDTNFVIGDNALNIPLVMNLNEWFRNPYIYDFNIDGNYSMGSSAAMAKLKANGVDIFHFQ